MEGHLASSSPASVEDRLSMQSKRSSQGGAGRRKRISRSSRMLLKRIGTKTSLPDFDQHLVRTAELWSSAEHLHPEWSKVQVMLHEVLESIYFKVVFAIVILVNIFLVVIECDSYAQHQAVHPGITWAIRCLLVLYIIEIMCRFFVYRTDFFYSTSNAFDLIIVLADLAMEAFYFNRQVTDTNFSLLRVVRVMKVLRVLRMFLQFRELFLLLNGLLSALKTIMWATFLIGILLTMWSILAVEYIHPLNVELAQEGAYNEMLCPRCKHAFESVMKSNLTFLQNIIAGYEETPVTVPIMEKHPWTAVVFIPLLLVLQLALLNLVVAVVIDAAQQSRLQDEHLAYAERAEQQERAKGKLLTVIKEMDRDSSGRLSYEELLKGYDTEPEFLVLMQLMDIARSDMETVFSMLDADGSGDVDYVEWVQQLNYMKNTKEHTLLIFIKHFIVEIRQTLKLWSPKVESFEEKLDVYEQMWKEERIDSDKLMGEFKFDIEAQLAEQNKKLEKLLQHEWRYSSFYKEAVQLTAPSLAETHVGSNRACEGNILRMPSLPQRPQSSRSPHQCTTNIIKSIQDECHDLHNLQVRLDTKVQELLQVLRSINSGLTEDAPSQPPEISMPSTDRKLCQRPGSAALTAQDVQSAQTFPHCCQIDKRNLKLGSQQATQCTTTSLHAGPVLLLNGRAIS